MAKLCGWCRRISRWERAVLLFALVLSRMHFPKILSEHEGDTADMGASGFAALSAVVVLRGGECLQCGRANLHVEQPDLLHEAIHASE